MYQTCTADCEKTELVYKPPIETDDKESDLDLEPECDEFSKKNRSSAQIQKHSKSTTVPTNPRKKTKEKAEKATAASASSASKTI
eukprot:12518686-Ditylum_brightwellii.AAC.1